MKMAKTGDSVISFISSTNTCRAGVILWTGSNSTNDRNLSTFNLETQFKKKTLKQVLSIPNTAANPAVYILSRKLPAEAIIYEKMLTFCKNISRLSDYSVEYRLAKRQK